MRNANVKNLFMEIQSECSEMWNERKGMDYTNNQRQLNTHFEKIKNHVSNIKELIDKIEADEYAFIQECYIKK